MITHEQKAIRMARAWEAYVDVRRYMNDDSDTSEPEFTAKQLGLAEAQAFILGDDAVASFAHQMRKDTSDGP